MSNHERESSRTPAGDTALDRAWQQVSDEQPPPALDAAIIAAAHKSTQGRNEQAQATRVSPPYRSWLTRWQPLAAAAAVAGLAFVLVQSLPRDHDVAPSMRMEEPATAPAATQEKPGSPATRESIEAKTASPPASAVARESVAAPASTNDQKSAADTVTTMRATEVEPRQLAAPEMAGRISSDTAAGAAAPIPAPARASASAEVSAAGESCKRQRGATRRHGPCCKGRGSLCRGRYRRCGRRTARIPCGRSGRGRLPPGIAPRLGANSGVTKAYVAWHAAGARLGTGASLRRVPGRAGSLLRSLDHAVDVERPDRQRKQDPGADPEGARGTGKEPLAADDPQRPAE